MSKPLSVEETTRDINIFINVIKDRRHMFDVGALDRLQWAAFERKRIEMDRAVRLGTSED